MEEARLIQWNDATTYFTKALDAHRIVGNEEGLALTYSQLGQSFLDAGDVRKAEKCFNNASEHFIKLGNAAGEAAVLRLLANVYIRVADRVSAIRCLERVVFLATHFSLPELNRDLESLKHIRQSVPHP
jgi:tetratricopeptide (TPR) repeat protein